MKITIYDNNAVSLLGRIAKINEYSAGKACNISIAIDNGKNYKDERIPSSFISVKSFHPEVFQLLKTGTMVQVIGHMAASSYTNAKGEKQYSQDIIADSILFRESKEIVDAREAAKVLYGTM